MESMELTQLKLASWLNSTAVKGLNQNECNSSIQKSQIF